jgi:hypothetical protein
MTIRRFTIWAAIAAAGIVLAAISLGGAYGNIPLF